MRGAATCLCLAAAITLAPAPAALSQEAVATAPRTVVRTLGTRMVEPPAEIARKLAAELPPEVPFVEGAGGLQLLAYAGFAVPQPLARFLAERIAGLDAAMLAPGRSVNLSLALVPDDGGTLIRLMLMGAGADEAAEIFARAFNRAPPADADVLMLESGGDGSNLVLAHPQSPDAAVALYKDHLGAAGFDLSEGASAAGTLLLGKGKGRSTVVFVQADQASPSRSVVVVRYLEE